MIEWLLLWVLLSTNALLVSTLVAYCFHRKHSYKHQQSQKSTDSLIAQLHDKLAREIQSRFQLSHEWNTMQSIYEKHSNQITQVYDEWKQQHHEELMKWKEAYQQQTQQWHEMEHTWKHEMEQIQLNWQLQDNNRWKTKYQQELQQWHDHYEVEIQQLKSKLNEMTSQPSKPTYDDIYIQKYDGETKMLKEEIMKLQEMCQTMLMKLPSVEKLAKEQHDLTEVYEDAVTKEGVMQQQLEDIQQKHTELERQFKDQFQHIIKQISQIRQQQIQLGQDISKSQQSSQDSSTQIDDMKQSLQDTKNIIQKLEMDLTTELDQIRASFKDLQTIYDTHHQTWSTSHSEFIKVISEFNDMHSKIQQQMIVMKQQEHDWRDKFHTLWNQFRTSIESRMEDEMKQSHQWIVQVQQLREDQKESTVKQNNAEKQLTWLKQKCDSLESLQQKQREVQDHKFKILEQSQQTIRDLAVSLTREEMTLRSIQQSQHAYENQHGTTMSTIQKQIQSLGTQQQGYKQQLDTFQHQVVRNYNNLLESLHHINERIGHEDSNALPKWHEGPSPIY